MRDIAESLGVTVQAVAAWECGGRPSPLNLSKYVSLLESLEALNAMSALSKRTHDTWSGSIDGRQAARPVNGRFGGVTLGRATDNRFSRWTKGRPSHASPRVNSTPTSER